MSEPLHGDCLKQKVDDLIKVDAVSELCCDSYENNTFIVGD